MSSPKTRVNDDSVEDFINSVDDDTRRQDSHKLLAIYEKLTGEPAKMWGSAIIGFGQYYYKSERSRQEGDWMLTGFSPRKQNLSLYFMAGFDDLQPLLDKLGKHKNTRGCLYISKLADIDLNVLKQLIKRSYIDMKKKTSR